MLTIIPVTCGYLLQLINITVLKKNPFNERIYIWIKRQNKTVVFGLQFLSVIELILVSVLLFLYPKIDMGLFSTCAKFFGIIIFQFVLGTIAYISKIILQTFL